MGADALRWIFTSAHGRGSSGTPSTITASDRDLCCVSNSLRSRPPISALRPAGWEGASVEASTEPRCGHEQRLAAGEPPGHAARKPGVQTTRSSCRMAIAS